MERVRSEPELLHLGIRRKVLDWMVPAVSLAALILLVSWVAIVVVNKKAPERLNAASVEVLKGESPEIEVEETPEGPVIRDREKL